MNVATITMDPAEARERLAEYAGILRRRADAEYEQIRAGLAAMARGEALVDVADAIRTVVRDAKDRPRLAIARADRKQVRFDWWPGDTASFRTRWSWGRGRASETMEVRLNMGASSPHNPTGYALVPIVPPAGLRLCGGFSGLRQHFVLWEVERWADSPIASRPDRDPYLLRHVAGDLYAVIYEWDLTELERAVMAGRRNG
jgi:hypothetical protein